MYVYLLLAISAAHPNAMAAVPAAGEGYESSAYSKEQSRSATPVLNGRCQSAAGLPEILAHFFTLGPEPNRPATPGTAHSALGSVQQTAPHTPLIKGRLAIPEIPTTLLTYCIIVYPDLPTMSTRNELGLEPDANTFGTSFRLKRNNTTKRSLVGPIVMPSTFEQLPASTGGDKAYAAGVTDGEYLWEYMFAIQCVFTNATICLKMATRALSCRARRRIWSPQLHLS